MILVARHDIDRRARIRERRRRQGVFLRLAAMNDIPGVNDQIGGRIEGVDIRDGALEIRPSLIGVGRIQGDMGIGNMRDDHDARSAPVGRRLA